MTWDVYKEDETLEFVSRPNIILKKSLTLAGTIRPAPSLQDEPPLQPTAELSQIFSLIVQPIRQGTNQATHHCATEPAATDPSDKAANGNSIMDGQVPVDLNSTSNCNAAEGVEGAVQPDADVNIINCGGELDLGFDLDGIVLSKDLDWYMDDHVTIHMQMKAKKDKELELAHMEWQQEQEQDSRDKAQLMIRHIEELQRLTMAAIMIQRYVRRHQTRMGIVRAERRRRLAEDMAAVEAKWQLQEAKVKVRQELLKAIGAVQKQARLVCNAQAHYSKHRARLHQRGGQDAQDPELATLSRSLLEQLDPELLAKAQALGLDPHKILSDMEAKAGGGAEDPAAAAPEGAEGEVAAGARHKGPPRGRRSLSEGETQMSGDTADAGPGEHEGASSQSAQPRRDVPLKSLTSEAGAGGSGDDVVSGSIMALQPTAGGPELRPRPRSLELARSSDGELLPGMVAEGASASQGLRHSSTTSLHITRPLTSSVEDEGELEATRRATSASGMFEFPMPGRTVARQCSDTAPVRRKPRRVQSLQQMQSQTPARLPELIKLPKPSKLSATPRAVTPEPFHSPSVAIVATPEASGRSRRGSFEADSGVARSVSSSSRMSAWDAPVAGPGGRRNDASHSHRVSSSGAPPGLDAHMASGPSRDPYPHRPRSSSSVGGNTEAPLDHAALVLLEESVRRRPVSRGPSRTSLRAAALGSSNSDSQTVSTSGTPAHGLHKGSTTTSHCISFEAPLAATSHTNPDSHPISTSGTPAHGLHKGSTASSQRSSFEAPLAATSRSSPPSAAAVPPPAEPAAAATTLGRVSRSLSSTWLLAGTHRKLSRTSSELPAIERSTQQPGTPGSNSTTNSPRRSRPVSRHPSSSALLADNSPPSRNSFSGGEGAPRRQLSSNQIAVEPAAPQGLRQQQPRPLTTTSVPTSRSSMEAVRIHSTTSRSPAVAVRVNSTTRVASGVAGKLPGAAATSPAAAADAHAVAADAASTGRAEWGPKGVMGWLKKKIGAVMGAKA